MKIYISLSLLLSFLFCNCTKPVTPDDNSPEIICDCNYQKFHYVKGTRYMWAPNSFTPNFDGLNDVYRLYQNQLDTSLFGLYIYNPQQKPIFYTNSYSKGWDGILGGKPAPAGNYPVIIKYIEADGDPVEKRICIYILPYDSTNNCFKSDNKTALIFGDQFDPVTSAIFPTNETICN